jgi:hypothetical protein
VNGGATTSRASTARGGTAIATEREELNLRLDFNDRAEGARNHPLSNRVGWEGTKKGSSVWQLTHFVFMVDEFVSMQCVDDLECRPRSGAQCCNGANQRCGYQFVILHAHLNGCAQAERIAAAQMDATAQWQRKHSTRQKQTRPSATCATIHFIYPQCSAPLPFLSHRPMAQCEQRCLLAARRQGQSVHWPSERQC